MEQKKEVKKRWRPSLGEYRELENVIHRQCVELDAWRERYRELEAGMEQPTAPGTFQDVTSRCLNAERSNKLLSEEMGRMRKKIGDLEYQLRDANSEIERLNARSFWKRVFNL